MIWETRNRHAHSSGADESSNEDQEILWFSIEVLADLLRDRDEQNAGYCMTDERGNDLWFKETCQPSALGGVTQEETTDQRHRREDENYRIEGAASQEILNLGVQNFEQAARDDALAEGDPSHRQEDNGPRKMLEIILYSVVNACSE